MWDVYLINLVIYFLIYFEDNFRKSEEVIKGRKIRLEFCWDVVMVFYMLVI